jgi:hypothetical protein
VNSMLSSGLEQQESEESEESATSSEKDLNPSVIFWKRPRMQ